MYFRPEGSPMSLKIIVKKMHFRNKENNSLGAVVGSRENVGDFWS